MAANPLKGEIEFQVDGKAVVLAYTIASLIALEERLDMGVEEIGLKMGDSPRVAFLRTVFWAGLIEHQPEIEEHAAGELMQAVGVERAGAMLGAAFQRAFAGPAEAKSPARPRRAAPRA